MGVFSKLFKKNKCPKCGLDLSTVSTIVHSSVPTAKCPQCDTDITNKLEFLDTRSEEEKQIERDAQSALTAEEEKLAKKLSYLSCQQDEQGRTLPEAKVDIRKLGEYLCANGGTNRMKKVAYRVQTLGGDVRTLQIFWDGICGWMA